MDKPDPSPDQKSQTDNQTDTKRSSSSDKSPQSSVEMSGGDASGKATTSAKSVSEPSSSSDTGAIISPLETSFQKLFEKENYKAIADMLEREELEASNGIPPTLVYERLLAIYLLQNDFHNAKLLWRRIPASVKLTESDLDAIWTIGQKVSQSDFAGIYMALRRPWINNTKLMDRMLEVTRRRAVELIAKAYESITLSNLATLLGTPEGEETKAAALDLNWVVDGEMAFPKSNRVAGEGRKFVSNDAHLGLLTDYVSFLESH